MALWNFEKIYFFTNVFHAKLESSNADWFSYYSKNMCKGFLLLKNWSKTVN